MEIDYDLWSFRDFARPCPESERAAWIGAKFVRLVEDFKNSMFEMDVENLM